MDNHTSAGVPSWGRRIDEYGRQHWHKDKPRHTRTGEYVGNIIVNLIFLWIISKIPDWHPDFIRDNFNVVVWVLQLNIFIQIGGNTLMILFDLPAVRYFARMITEAASFVSMMVLYFIFPFDFTNYHGLFWLNWFLPLMLILGMVVSAIKVLANLWKLVFWRG